MPIVVLSYMLQIACAVHALKRGYPIQIVFLIVAFPFFGCVIYAAAVALPELRKSRAARQAGAVVRQTIDPGRRMRQRAEALAISDTIENKMKLADELIAMGDPASAIALYQACLEGMFADNPDILLRLARACFAIGDYRAAKDAMDQIAMDNASFHSEAAHLLYARILEALGETEAALAEYRAVCHYYSGPEAKCRHATMLKSIGRLAESRAIVHEVLDGARFVSPQLRRRHRDWLQWAEAELR